MDLLLDPIEHDLVFINGECPVTQRMADIVAQRLKITLLTFYGEWFLDTTIGIPYFEQVFGKSRARSTIDVLFQSHISADPDVVEIKEFSSQLDPATREYSMVFVVRVEDNTESLPIEIRLGV